MKNILIAGPSRSGKSTLAKRINEELGHFVISLDKLVSVFHGAYPQLDIRLNWDRAKTTDNLAPFLGHFLGAFSASEGYARELNLRAHAVKGNKFVLEGGYFNFEKILPVLQTYGIENLKNGFILVGLAQNNKTAEEFFSGFRKYDTPDDWTYGMSDGDLMDVSRDAVTFSHSMTEHLTRYGFTVYDTAVEREQVFKQIMADIIKPLRKL